MLDYVYRNRAEGISPLGKMIDRIYLNNTGWRQIRTRGEHLKSMLTNAIRRRRISGEAVHVVDIAAGPGRYLLDTVQQFGEAPIFATCRDQDRKGLEAGRKLTRHKNITRVSYEVGDAFSTAALATLDPKPDVVVVSGLYELFSDNRLIAQSLAGIYAALKPGAYLIYTNQPCHPQQELIARTLTNRDGEPWIMRLRSQAEMNQLAESAGFQPLETRIDSGGIFSVTLARKKG